MSEQPPEAASTLVCPVCGYEKIRREGLLYTAQVPTHCGKVMREKVEDIIERAMQEYECPSCEAYQHNFDQVARDVVHLSKENAHLRVQLYKAYSLLSTMPAHLTQDTEMVHLWVAECDTWLNEQIQEAR